MPSLFTCSYVLSAAGVRLRPRGNGGSGRGLHRSRSQARNARRCQRSHRERPNFRAGARSPGGLGGGPIIEKRRIELPPQDLELPYTERRPDVKASRRRRPSVVLILVAPFWVNPVRVTWPRPRRAWMRAPTPEGKTSTTRPTPPRTSTSVVWFPLPEKSRLSSPTPPRTSILRACAYWSLWSRRSGGLGRRCADGPPSSRPQRGPRYDAQSSPRMRWANPPLRLGGSQYPCAT